MNIMIVDPSEVSRTVIENFLLKMGVTSRNIHLFVDGEQAIEFSRDEEVDILFSALNLPGIDGIDFIDIVLNEQPKLVSKLFVLSSNDKDVFDDVKDIGAKRFIRKPINEEYFNHFVGPEIEKTLEGF